LPPANFDLLELEAIHQAGFSPHAVAVGTAPLGPIVGKPS
jgi:hypothetical protein